MKRQQTLVDDLIARAIERLAEHGSFYKSDVVSEVSKTQTFCGIQRVLKDADLKAPRAGIGIVYLRGFDDMVTRALQARDENGIRLYECEASGTDQRRWMRLRAMGLEELKQVIRPTRELQRTIRVKVDAYSIYLQAMEAIGRTDVTVDDVYERCLPEIRKLRAA